MRQRFPVSDHCDGRRFFNPGESRGHRGLLQVLRWRLRSKPAGWPRRVTDPVYPPPPPDIAPGSVAVSFINHATFLIGLPGVTVLTDPIFSQRCSPLSWAGPQRARAPGIALADLPPVDIVLLSHNHYDHMDLPTLRTLQRRDRPWVVTTLGNARPLARLGIEATELDWWQSAARDTLMITATPTRHFSARTPWDRNRTLWGGFMLATAEGQVLFAGDSGAGPHWHDIRARLGSPGVALVPIGAYEPRWFMAPVHMNPAEAVQAHLDLRAGQSVGMHFGTFRLTDEAIDAPEIALSEACRTKCVPAAAFTTQGFGETRVYPLIGPPPP